MTVMVEEKSDRKRIDGKAGRVEKRGRRRQKVNRQARRQ